MRINKHEVQSLYRHLQNVFHHDEWIIKEYSGGFNAHVLADPNGIEDVLAISETALQVSGQVTGLLLEKVREHGARDYIRYDASGMGFTEEQ